MGIETEFGVTCTFHGQRRLSPDEVARYLFRRVVSWGRSSNVFLRNGARLYLDVGSHPEYATAECDNLAQLVTHDKAGERVLEDLLVDAEQRLADEGIGGDIYLFKNNTDSAGNSYGCHENYLIVRAGEFSRIADVLLPFLVTRQLICGAGKVLQTPKAAHVLPVPARRAHLGGRLQRDHPVPADHQHPRRAARRRREVPPAARHRRRLEHVRDDHHAQGRHRRAGAGDDRGRACRSATSPSTTRSGRSARSATTSPAAGRSGWPAAGRPARWTSSASTTPGPSSTCRRASPTHRSSRSSTCGAARSTPSRAQDFAKVDTEIDWVIKRKLFERYQDRYNMDLTDPKIAQLDLAYHDIKRGRGVFDLLQRKGLAARVTTDEEIEAGGRHPAADHPGQAARRVHRRRPGRRPRLHRRLGAPQAQRPGAAHRAVQGPVPVGRRAGEAAHRQHVTGARRSEAARPALG